MALPEPYPVAPPGAPRLEAPGALAALVCGIIGVALAPLGLVLGIVALVQQKKARALIAAYPDRFTGGGYCTAGLVLGIIGVVFGAFWTVYLIVASVFFSIFTTVFRGM